MKPTPKQKIYGGIVAAGLAALITDQLTRPGPQASDASEIRAAVALTAAKPVHSVQTEKPAKSITELLRDASQEAAWTSAADRRDPFRPTLAWGASAMANEAPPAVPPAAKFAAAHHLTSTVTAGSNRHVMVDGRILNQGQTFDGFTLVAIEARAAVFEANGQAVTLRLVDQGIKPTPAGPAAR